ncbi:hypothetical protein RE9431_44410 [Prescottella equi]|nr:hypothetical protein RE9414_44660 [Prescottella equi]BCN56113.1 hypothetical protein RE9425_45030 [Prescottella equi]BCN61033.1 hypothetical protein RE9427_44030 [Prescottella equi]BCN65986.1 hypothetical protein RE9431_44410 [Prescottella equi]BCN75824.1 hypothetical protein RE0327_44230 [Prescottella equi]
MRDALADALTGARDECDLAVEVAHVYSLSKSRELGRSGVTDLQSTILDQAFACAQRFREIGDENF